MKRTKQIFNLFKPKIYYLVVIGIFIACVEPYELKVITNQTILIVDGAIDDTSTDQYINLKKFIPSEQGNIRY